MSWPDVLFRQTSDVPVSALLMVIAVILVVWGVSLIHVALLPPKRFAFEFWLGSFMLADATLYGLLAITTLQSPDGIDLWVALYFLCVSVPSVVAFWHWGRDRLPGRQERVDADTE